MKSIQEQKEKELTEKYERQIMELKRVHEREKD